MNNYYNKSLKKFAHINRKSATKAEIKIWCELLRKSNIMNYSFKRQRPIENYIVDFYCKELKLIIEIDGVTHHHIDTIIKDVERENVLRQLGFSILRFSDNDVMNNLENVRWTIESWIINYNESVRVED